MLSTLNSNASPQNWRHLAPEQKQQLKELLTAEVATRRRARWPTPGSLAQAVVPGTVQTPALELIDQALVDVDEGRCPRLIISMPPQEGKSERISRTGVLWFLLHNPERRIAVVSYQDEIAARWGRQIKTDITNNAGDDGTLDLGLRIRDDSRAAGRWQLDGHRGGVVCVGIEGSITGRPVDLLVIDDPVKGRTQAESETLREAARDFWRGTGVPRLAPGAPAILVMTRWHEDDLAGWLIEEEKLAAASGAAHYDQWRVINIPAQADHRPELGETDLLGRQPGEYLLSARGRVQADWESRRIAVGSRDWNALYQGRPAPAEGDILKRGWWRRYTTPIWTVDEAGAHRCDGVDELVASWDMAFKDTKGSDYVVGSVWARKGARVWLVDLIRARLSFTASQAAVRRLAEKWPQARVKLIEDKANGPAIIDSLRLEVAGLIAVEPDGSKFARASAVAPFVEAGNVWIPDAGVDWAPWVDEFVEECAGFPNSAHDDQVDSMSQALARLLIRPSVLAGYMAQLSPPCPKCGEPVRNGYCDGCSTQVAA